MTEDILHKEENTAFLKVNSFGFISILIVGGFLFFAIGKNKTSLDEKRDLAQMPSIKFDDFKSGILTRNIDLYYSDNFEFRDLFINMANSIKEIRGVNNPVEFFYKENQKENNLKNDNNSSLLATIDSQKNKGIEPKNITTEESTDNEYDETFETIKSVVVFNKRAIQIFGGTNTGASNYAKMISQYKTELGDKINVYCMPIPVGSDFYLPKQINKKSERKFINQVFTQLSTGVKQIDAYSELERHSNEYIQFNTDHHWTGLGAYYAYTKFCEGAGISAIPIKNLEKKTIQNFLGTLYYYTKSSELKKYIDSVDYYKIPFETKMAYTRKGDKTERTSKLYAEYARGGNAYGVFLGGDFPFTRITNPLKNGRKILVFKDSYGNAFVPYLASHYDEVIVIDYRYYYGNIKDLVKSNGITDILFAHNVYAANSSFTIKRETSMLNYGYSKIKK